MNKSVSPSRTYVAMCSGPNFVGYRFKKFVLPEKDLDLQKPALLENDSDTASWYYLNRVTQFDCIDGCISFEDFMTVFPVMKVGGLLTQLTEIQKLLKNIKQDTVNGQISDIAKDIDAFFDKYPDWEELSHLSHGVYKGSLLRYLK